jgi:hypothetical protein
VIVNLVFLLVLQREPCKVRLIRGMTKKRQKMKVGNPKLDKGNSKDDISHVPLSTEHH